MDIFEGNDNSSDEEDPVEDSDTCREDELSQIFVQPYHLATEEAVSLKKTYILSLSATSTFDRIACSTSNNVINCYNINEYGLSVSNTNKLQFDNLCDLKFSKKEPNILYVGSSNGYISLYDFRSESIQSKFEDNKHGKMKNVTSFDINENDRILCVGTKQIEREVCILFFDIRTNKLLGGYWDSHNDDITQIKFHGQNDKLLATGSKDGLINIFDISETDEDEALQFSLNTENDVQLLSWHKDIYDKDLLSCITHTDLYLYDGDEWDLIAKYSRETITAEAQRKSSMYCNLINCHTTNDGETFLLANSNYKKGECFRSLTVQSKMIFPRTNFVGNKQIIRTSLFNNSDGTIITGGEGGIISVWRPGSPIPSNQSSLKEVSKLNDTKRSVKPY